MPRATRIIEQGSDSGPLVAESCADVLHAIANYEDDPSIGWPTFTPAEYPGKYLRVQYVFEVEKVAVNPRLVKRVEDVTYD